MNLSETELNFQCSEELGMLTDAATSYLRENSTIADARRLAGLGVTTLITDVPDVLIANL